MSNAKKTDGGNVKMNFKQLEGFAFDKESKELGAIASVDFLEQTITIMMDEENIVVAKLANVEFLEQIGTIGEVAIVNHDVVTTTDGKLFELELQKDGKNVQMHLLNGKLERTEKGDLIPREKLESLNSYVELVDSIYLLEPEEEEAIDFNIRIVRKQTNGDFSYSYACNNIEEEQIDLIKVIFLGNHLLEEENYERETVSHEDYLELIEDGTLKEVSPNELMNYVTGMMYKPKSNGFEVSEDEDCETCNCTIRCEDEDENECEDNTNYCAECGEDEDNCECKGW